MYNPAEGGVFDNEEYEYIEMKNIGAAPLQLEGVKLTNGVTFRFPRITLNAGGYMVVVKNPAAFASRYTVPAGVPVLGPYDGQLSNSGETLKLEDSTNSTVVEFKYSDGWYDVTDGAGFSLTVKDPTGVGAEPDALDSKGLWRASANTGGSPGY